jgi:hypothetical protein
MEGQASACQGSMRDMAYIEAPQASGISENLRRRDATSSLQATESKSLTSGDLHHGRGQGLRHDRRRDGLHGLRDPSDPHAPASPAGSDRSADGSSRLRDTAHDPSVLEPICNAHRLCPSSRRSIGIPRRASEDVSHSAVAAEFFRCRFRSGRTPVQQEEKLRSMLRVTISFSSCSPFKSFFVGCKLGEVGAEVVQDARKANGWSRSVCMVGAEARSWRV